MQAAPFMSESLDDNLRSAWTPEERARLDAQPIPQQFDHTNRDHEYVRDLLGLIPWTFICTCDASRCPSELSIATPAAATHPISVFCACSTSSNRCASRWTGERRAHPPAVTALIAAAQTWPRCTASRAAWTSPTTRTRPAPCSSPAAAFPAAMNRPTLGSGGRSTGGAACRCSVALALACVDAGPWGHGPVSMHCMRHLHLCSGRQLLRN